jgi:hypothetical protein
MRNTMKMLLVAALPVLLLALLGTGGAGAQAGPVFPLYSPDPVVPHGTGDTWDNPYTDPGAVFYYNGKFHMFRNGFRSWPASVQWGYVTSPDGLTWTKQGDAPVFMTKQVPYAGTAALASSVLVLDDGTWVIYFYTYGDGGDRTGNWSIGRATAPGPTGPWKADAAPVLTPGPADSWDPKLSSPSVIRTADGYVMYFDGGDPIGTSMLGMATSKDGIHWTKYNDPATGGQFAESDPILQPSTDAAAWDQIALDHPRVVQTPQGWVMLYRSAQRRAGGNALGYALSSDGIHWARAAANPILSWRLIPGGDGVYYCDLVYHDGTYFVLWEVTKGASSQIYLATHEGPLPTDAVAAPVVTATPLAAATTPAPGPTSITLPGSGSQAFAETGKNLTGVFLDYWKSHTVAKLGSPISDLAQEVSDLDGKPYTVQYFHGSLLEYHPENQPPFTVLLAHLGRFAYAKQYPQGAPGQTANTTAGAVHFAPTGHTLGGPFLAYWQQTGGLMQHGFPISDELTEASPLDSQPYLTQYFERAVFEYHPATGSGPGTVLARPLGALRYASRASAP